MDMADAKKRVPMVDVLREAVRNCGLSYKEIGRRAAVDPAQLTRFVSQGRDLTLAVGSRLCIVLGLELVRTGDVLEEAIDAEEVTSTRRKVADGSLAEVERGQGRRVDLERKEETKDEKKERRKKR